MGPSPPPQGPWWSWGIGGQGMHSIWLLDRIEDKNNNGGDGGLRFSLQFDPGKAGLDRTLLGLPVSALLSHLLGWSKSSTSQAMADGGGETAAGVAATLASVFVVYLVSMFASDHPRQPCRPLRLRPRLAGLNSSARPRALPTPDDGLRILSSNEECLENVIHGASVGAGDDEPDIVARVVMAPTDDMAGANADGGGETERDDDRSEKKRREEEVERLKELWLSLMEREQRLQLRLAELDELREQEAACELERRVGAAAVEAQLLELKVASLQEENRRLEAQASELDAVRGKLARAKEKLRELRTRVDREQEASEREAAALRDRVAELERNGEERERTMAAEDAALRDRVTEMEKDGEEREDALAAEAEAVRRRMKELEKNFEERERALAAEAAVLRTANAGLEEENLELALRLQEAEQTVSTVNLVLEEDVIKKDKYLRETNERLTRQIEQLHSDHCARVEELVYLKWVNACLRYELRTQDGGDGGGRLSARDLSKSMSFRSSEKAKELMLKYGTHGLDGFDPSIFSPLHESVYGDGDDFEHRKPNGVVDAPRSPGTSVATAAAAPAAAESPSRSAGHGKLKFLGNIKKLLVSNQKGHGHGHGRGDRRSSKKQAAAPPRDEHLEKALQWLSSHDALDDDSEDDSYECTLLSSSCERTPLSSVTTVGSTHARIGGGGVETAAAAASRLLEAETERTRSDVGASYGREAASRYHALRPDHPATRGGRHDDDGPRASPEKREMRRRSEELRSPAAMYASARDHHMHQLQSNA